MDKIGHYYGDLNVKIIWDTISVDIPILLKHCIAGIEELKAKNNSKEGRNEKD